MKNTKFDDKLKQKYQVSDLEWTEMSYSSKGLSFCYWIKSPLSPGTQSGWVYLTNLLGKMANINNNDKTTIGLNSILIDKETTVGAIIIPNKLIASMIPAAVD